MTKKLKQEKMDHLIISNMLKPTKKNYHKGQKMKIEIFLNK